MHVVVHAGDAWLERIAWCYYDQAQEPPLGRPRRLPATDPPKWLAILRVLGAWEHGRICSKVWVASQQYRAGEWARMSTWGIQAQRMRGWAGMVGGDWEGEEEVKEVKEDNPQNTTPQTPSHQN